MRIWIVVEGKSDAEILARLLPNDVKEIASVYSVGERSNISSVASTLLVKHQEAVIVLADADSLDADIIRDRYCILNELLSLVAGGTPFKVILSIPSIEAIFFDLPEILERLFHGKKLEQMLLFYKAQPKAALEMLFREGNGPLNLKALLAALTEEDLIHLNEQYPIREIIEFARQVSSPIGSHTAT